MSIGHLFLIPVIISEGTENQVIPPVLFEKLKLIRHFLAEDVRTARRFLSSLKIYESIESLNFSVLNKDTQREALLEMFTPLYSGDHLGVVSESGCPGIADPGAMAVDFAHQNNIRVIPLVGPSSILLALMASGLNGQQFAFHGYLPIEAKECIRKIKTLEKESSEKHQTQIFIETPYRNNQVLKNLVEALHDTTWLSVAIDLTGKNESIRTRSVGDWKKDMRALPKEPAVISFLA